MDQEQLQAHGRNIFTRAKNIILSPKTEWPVIETEMSSQGAIYGGYVVPLALIKPVCVLIGTVVFGYSFLGITYRPSLMDALPLAIVTFVLTLVSVFIMTLVVDFLAPQFGGVASKANALKLVAYGSTAAWVAGLFSIVPGLGVLGILGLYSVYLFYVGAPVMMKLPEDKVMIFMVVLIVALIIVYALVGAIATSMVGSSLYAGMHGGSLSFPH